MTRDAKHLKRRKERARSKAKRIKSDHDWARFHHIRKTLRQHMKRAYVDYINNLVDPEKDEGNKNLWRYLKSQKQDHVGVAPLKSVDKLVTDAAGKADVLSHQFSSVFTQEQVNTMPDKGASPCPNQPRWLSGLRRSRVHSLVIARVLRNWDRILVRAVKGLISRAGMVSICPLL